MAFYLSVKIFDLILDASTANGRGRTARAILYGWFAVGVLSYWMFFWWSVGMWPTETFGAGFAKVEQVKALYIDNLERDLIDVRIRHCTAVNAQSQLFFFARLQEKERAYFNVTGLAYVRPACSEVVSASG